MVRLRDRWTISFAANNQLPIAEMDTWVAYLNVFVNVGQTSDMRKASCANDTQGIVSFYLYFVQSYYTAGHNTGYFIFHYNSRIYWWIFTPFVPMETEKNTMQCTAMFTSLSYFVRNNNAMQWNMAICWVLNIKLPEDSTRNIVKN